MPGRKTPADRADSDIRGWLENKVRRSQRIIKGITTDRRQSAAERLQMADAAAIIKLAGSLLDHMDAEAKQARADEVESGD